MSDMAFGSVTLPAEFGAFSAVPSTIYNHEKEKAGLGYSVQYSGDRASLTVYAYTLGIVALPNSISSDQFQRQMQECVEGVVNSLPWTELKVADEGTAGLPNRANAFQYVVLQGTTSDSPRPIHSIVWLTVVNGSFVKVRCTTRASNLTSALVQNVARGLLLHFEPPAARSTQSSSNALQTPLAQSVCRLVSRESGAREGTLHPDMAIREELGIVDVNLITLVMALEEEFGIELPDEVMDAVVTVGDLVAVVQGLKVQPGQAQAPGPTPAAVRQPAPTPQKEGLLSRLFGRR